MGTYGKVVKMRGLTVKWLLCGDLCLSGNNVGTYSEVVIMRGLTVKWL